jgi:hypothetical protein
MAGRRPRNAASARHRRRRTAPQRVPPQAVVAIAPPHEPHVQPTPPAASARPEGHHATSARHRSPNTVPPRLHGRVRDVRHGAPAIPGAQGRDRRGRGEHARRDSDTGAGARLSPGTTPARHRAHRLPASTRCGRSGSTENEETIEAEAQRRCPDDGRDRRHPRHPRERETETAESDRGWSYLTPPPSRDRSTERCLAPRHASSPTDSGTGHPRRRDSPGHAAPQPTILNAGGHPECPRLHGKPDSLDQHRETALFHVNQSRPRPRRAWASAPHRGQPQGGHTWSPSQTVSQSRLDPVTPSDSEDPRRATQPVIASAPDMALGAVLHVEPPAHPTGGRSGDSQGEPALFHVKRTPPVDLWPRSEHAS